MLCISTFSNKHELFFKIKTMIVSEAKQPLRRALKGCTPPNYSRRILDMGSLTPGLICPDSHLPPGSPCPCPAAENESSLGRSSWKWKPQTHSQKAASSWALPAVEESVWTWMRQADSNNLSEPQFLPYAVGVMPTLWGCYDDAVR